MKHIQTFESFLNEATITLVKMMTPPMSSDANRGKMETVNDLTEIKQYLKDSEHFTDDEVFFDEKGNEYSIDDLIGKSVKVGGELIKVTESFDGFEKS